MKIYFKHNCGLYYIAKNALSFNEGGRYFNFHLNWQDPCFYLYGHCFRFFISFHKKSDVSFEWLGFK